MYMQHFFIFLFLLIFKRGFFVNGISCYECTGVSASSLCISDGGTATDCDKKYCTIYRQEYLDPAGKIQHFYRGCEDSPSYLNAVIQTPNHRAYYRACDSDLCNAGDGIEEFTIEFKNSSSTTIYIVPGVGSGADKTFRLDRLIVVPLINLALLLPRQIMSHE